MKLTSLYRAKIVVNRFYAVVYDENNQYYTRFNISNDCIVTPGEYFGYALIEYVTYKDKKDNTFKSFLVFTGID